jgi:hypothetical protein
MCYRFLIQFSIIGKGYHAHAVKYQKKETVNFEAKSVVMNRPLNDIITP